MTKPNYILQTYIRCSQDALWAALRDADAVVHYDFIGQTATRADDTLTYFAPDGSTTLRAREIEVTPQTRLVTTFEPQWAPDLATSRIAYDIEVFEDYCRLTVTHEDILPEDREEVADGWARSMAGLKTWLETGKPANFGGPELMGEA
jgi:hypothetical protein